VPKKILAVNVVWHNMNESTQAEFANWSEKFQKLFDLSDDEMLLVVLEQAKLLGRKMLVRNLTQHVEQKAQG